MTTVESTKDEIRRDILRCLHRNKLWDAALSALGYTLYVHTRYETPSETYAEDVEDVDSVDITHDYSVVTYGVTLAEIIDTFDEIVDRIKDIIGAINQDENVLKSSFTVSVVPTAAAHYVVMLHMLRKR